MKKHEINEKAWNSMEKHATQWKSMEINEKACNSMEKHGTQ